MKKQRYQIDKNGNKEEVEGYVFNKVWGVDKRAPQHYVLTHIPTGYFVDSSRTLKFFKELLAEPYFFEEELDIKKLSETIKKFRDDRWEWG